MLLVTLSFPGKGTPINTEAQAGIVDTNCLTYKGGLARLGRHCTALLALRPHPTHGRALSVYIYSNQRLLRGTAILKLTPCPFPSTKYVCACRKYPRAHDFFSRRAYHSQWDQSQWNHSQWSSSDEEASLPHRLYYPQARVKRRGIWRLRDENPRSAFQGFIRQVRDDQMVNGRQHLSGDFFTSCSQVQCLRRALCVAGSSIIHRPRGL